MSDKPEWIEAMSVLSLEPGDIVVVKVSTRVMPDAAREIRKIISGLVGAPVLLLDNEMEIGVLRQAA